MRWIKIEPGCEMPIDGERLIVARSSGWEEAEWIDGYFSVPGGEELHGVTHYLRVQLPG